MLFLLAIVIVINYTSKLMQLSAVYFILIKAHTYTIIFHAALLTCIQNESKRDSWVIKSIYLILAVLHTYFKNNQYKKNLAKHMLASNVNLTCTND